MPSECDKCGEHTLNCNCEKMKAVFKHFDEKLLGCAPVSTSFKKVKQVPESESMFYGQFCYLTSEAEKSIAALDESQLFILAEVMADQMRDTYRDLIMSNLKKLKKQKESV